MAQNTIKIFITLILLVLSVNMEAKHRAKLFGRVSTADKQSVEFATVYIKGTNIGTTTDTNGKYDMLVGPGQYTLVVSAIGYEAAENQVTIKSGDHLRVNFEMNSSITELEEVVVTSSGVARVNESAYNAIAIDTKGLHNSTLDLANALNMVSGVKLRESGGVGSDMQFMLDGFSGKHVKVFVDGVPLESGSSFGLNNIPINFAERIEVYRGVVPVNFGADALGGVVNIVTGNKRKMFVDASYSYGSFNTHKSYVNFGHTSKKGFTFEVNAFQNYSDNNYNVDTAVEDLENGQIEYENVQTVKRFHDAFRNEAIIGKIGVVNKKFADKMIFGVTLSQSDKEIQTGVRQEIVFGEKRRKASSVMPAFEYRKRDLLLKGLDVNLNASYNRNMTHNLDTATYQYNWNGDSKYNGGKLGEQQYQDAKFSNDNWTGTFNLQYNIGQMHSIVFNHVLTAFDRRTESTAGDVSGAAQAALFDKRQRKNISGLSYRINYNDFWNISAFGKYYNQSCEGPRNQSTTGAYDFAMFKESVDMFGYGMAGTVFFLKDLQAKVSYERAGRLPSIDELFGDEDLEMGAVELRPEISDNINVSLAFDKMIGKHSVHAEGSLIYRDTKDFIRRTTNKLSGGLYYASHENYGRVKTSGFSFEARYGYSRWLSIGGNITSLSITDNERYQQGSNKENLSYKVRMPNVPYMFANADASFNYNDLFRKGNVLTFNYNCAYVHAFPLRTETFGSVDTKNWVPDQLSHDVSVTYSMLRGRYNISFECKNLTDSKLYDNFSLQKPGRAFYGKFRVYFGN